MMVNGNDILVQANGTSICYDDLGVGGIPMIFIHGFPFDKSMWQPQVEFFKSKQRVLAFDIRGYGKSNGSSEKTSIKLYADDLVSLLDVLQIHRVIACGLSMGGYVLLNALSRYPERFSAVALCDTQCIADSAEAKEKRVQSIQQIEAEGLSGFADGFVNKCFSKESLLNKVELVEKIKTLILSASKESVTGTLAALAERSEMCYSLKEITIPALILCGKEDAITPLAQSEFMRGAINDSTLHSIAGAGHLSNLEEPNEFNRLLSDFISTRVK